jgi:hypothetical protein
MATGIDSATAAVLDALRRGDPFCRRLLIFDNADLPEDLNDVIPHGPGRRTRNSRACPGGMVLIETDGAIEQAGILKMAYGGIRETRRRPAPYAPWRSGPRPLNGLLQGAYAFLGVSGFWRQQRRSPGRPTDTPCSPARKLPSAWQVSRHLQVLWR